MGIATVITSGKGGVGKSTLSVGIGQALAEKGKRVLLVDCDAGLRSLDGMTGVRSGLVYDISDVVFGRCAPSHAIYPCEQREGLFLMPASLSAVNVISARVMKRLISLLKDHFDHVILDSPAGIGTGFKSSSAAADRALVVCTADPVSIAGGARVRDMLEEMEKGDIRLIINRLNRTFFDKTKGFSDLDEVVDAAGIQLLGVVPEDFDFAGAVLNGEKPEGFFSGMMAASRIASRLEGEEIPIVLNGKGKKRRGKA